MLSMLDIMTIVYRLSDSVTATKLRMSCKRMRNMPIIVDMVKTGNITSYRVGTVYHREDGPAVVGNGSSIWYYKGKIHREGGPAYVNSGYSVWYKHGAIHREDGPAIVHTKYEKWYINDVIHRADGPAILYANGDEEWYYNGRRHRENGPAIRLKGMIGYYTHGAEEIYTSYVIGDR